MKKRKGFIKEVTNGKMPASLSHSYFSVVNLRRRITMSNRRQFVYQTAAVLLACVLLLPGPTAAQDLSTVEARAAWIIKQYEGESISLNAKLGPAIALARLELNPNDTYVIDRITRYYDNIPAGENGEQFTYPGVAWVLGKYWDKFTPAQRDHLKEKLKGFDNLLDGGTENHARMKNVAAYLFAQYWPDETGWLRGTMTSTQMMAEARRHLLDMYGSMYDMGFEENHSNNYVPVHLFATYALYDCAAAPGMKAVANASLQFYVAYEVATHFEAVPIPPANRDYPDQILNTHAPGTTPGKPNMGWIHWLYWADAMNWNPATKPVGSGNSDAHYVGYASVSSWRPSAVLSSIARGNTAPYELTTSGSGDPGTAGFMVRSPGGHVGYIYRDKLYAMGSGYLRYDQTYQHYWNFTTFRAIYKSPDRFNFIECYHPFWRSNDRSWSGLNSPFEQWAQHKGTAIVLFNIPNTDPWEGRGDYRWNDSRNKHFDNLIQEALLRYPKSIDQKTEANGWIFLREGDVYIAIRPLKDYTIDADYSPAGGNFNVIRSAFAKTGFVFDIATKEEFATFEEFQTAVSQNPPVVDWDQLSVAYTNVNGDTLSATWNPPNYAAQTRVLVRPDITVNSAVVPIDADYLNGKAVMKSPSVELTGRVLQLQTPTGRLVVDWSGEYPIIGSHYYAAQIVFTDSVSGNPLEGLDVILHGGKYITDTQGMISIPEILEGIYKLAVTDSRFLFTENPEIKIQSDSLYRIHVKKIPRLTLKVINRTSGASVYRASVIAEGKTYPSDAMGFVNIVLPSPGTLITSIEHRDYFSVSDTILVLVDTTILITLTPTRANVTFSFSDITGSVNGVKVTMTGSQYTNSSGKAFFFPSRHGKSIPGRQKRLVIMPCRIAFILKPTLPCWLT